MNKKKSKVLAFLLATAMLVPSANGIVSAAEINVNREVSKVSEEIYSVESIQEDKVDVDSQTTATDGIEATADGVEYKTLKEALEAGGEVKLLRDVEVDDIINITKDTTLDLGDFTIINNAPKRVLFVETENFNIKANKGGMVIPKSNTGAFGFVEAYVTNFKILGGNYSGDTDNGRLFRINTTDSKKGTLKVDGIVANTNNEIIGHKDKFTNYSGSITNSELYTDTRAIYFDIIDNTETSTINIEKVKSISARGPVIEVSGGNTVLSNNDWTVTGDYTGGNSWARAAVGVGSRANVTIKSGNYIADSDKMKSNEGYGVYIYTSGGTVNIEGGNFAGTTASLRADVDKDTYNNPASIIVNNGEFKGDLLAATKTGIESITINGGKFTGVTDKTGVENNITINGGIFDKNMNNFLGADVKYTLKNEDDKNNIKYGYFKTQEETLNSPMGGKVESNTTTETEDVKFVMNDDITITIPTEVVENKDTNKKEIVIKVKKQEKEGYEFVGFRYRGRMYGPGDTITIPEEEFSNDGIQLIAEWNKEDSTPSYPSYPSIPSKPSKPTYTHEEIIGSDRYDTAAKIADKLGSYDNVVLVNATSTMSDGLSASGLAGKENGAILLTKKDSIPKATMDRIKKVKKVYIIGGEAAISQKVANEITAAGIKVERLGGKDRVETSKLVAEKLGNYKEAFVVNGFKGEADAMSASAAVAKNGAPILLTNGKTSNHDKKSGVEYYVIGGNSVVDKSIADKYDAEVLAGKDRYETNREVIAEFYSNSDKLYLANGDTLVDALTASPLAKNEGIVLVNKKSDNSILKDKHTVQVGGMNFEIEFEK